MRENLTRTLARYRRTFGDFTTGQKAVVLVGTGALILATFLVFRWVSSPSYSPLYTNLAAADASSVVDELNKEGVKYKLADDGSTIEVPSNAVYSTRIAMAGQGLPQSTATLGYGILDNESISTSDFQQQTDFKRAMEGELDNTLEAMQGIQTAVVHLATPTQQVFTSTQQPTTASVLLELQPGVTLSDQQVQAIVHLVASSVDGLDPKDVTVSDGQGNLLSDGSDDTAGLSSTQSDAVQKFEDTEQQKVQTMLDQIVGPGNATAAVTAQLDFDQQTTDKTVYGKGKAPSGSFTKTKETYRGVGSGTTAGGVVGPDGQFEPSAVPSGADGTYDNTSETSDNRVDVTRTQTVAAPGTVQNMHIMVALDSAAIGTIQPNQIGQMISAGMGIETKRGDSVVVNAFPFNRSAQQAAQQELNAAAAAAAHARTVKLIRDIGIGVLVALMALLVWWRARRRAQAREEATTYVVEQLRADAAARAAQLELANPALAALEAAESHESLAADTLREELNALVDEQPEDVAALLRGWLVERPR